MSPRGRGIELHRPRRFVKPPASAPTSLMRLPRAGGDTAAERLEADRAAAAERVGNVHVFHSGGRP